MSAGGASEDGAPMSEPAGRVASTARSRPGRRVTSSESYVLKDFAGSSHRILAGWLRELPADTRLLELGCGAGHVARLTRRPDLVWHGLESSVECLPVLSGLLGGGALVDLETLRRLPGGYGAVLAADTLEHLNAPERMLALVHDALLPGGRLFLSVPNVANVYVRANLLAGRFPYADRGILDRTHRVFFTRKSLHGMLADAGFALERQAVSTLPLPLALPALPRAALAWMVGAVGLATRVWPTLWGYQLLAVARRA
jgi:SAM-dependent methyltransferase